MDLFCNPPYHRHDNAVAALLIRAVHRYICETEALREALQRETFVRRDLTNTEIIQYDRDPVRVCTHISG